VLNEYTNYKGVLLDIHEWSGGISIRDPAVGKEQSKRRKEVKEGKAKEVQFS